MLHIQKYVDKASMWPMIKKYLVDQGKYDETSSDDSICEFLVRSAKNSFYNNKEADTFRKAITGLKEGRFATINRRNQLRLCFALNLKNQNQVDHLFLDYLHVNALSARNLSEFIVICGINCGMKWDDISQLMEKYKTAIAKQPAASSNLKKGQTATFIIDTVSKITTRKELEAYLNDSNNLSFFAKTRNTHYMALFHDCIPCWSANRKVWLAQPTDDAEESGQSFTRIVMKNYYANLFYIHSNEEESQHNYLEESDITALIPVFPDTFMTYAKFRDLVQRRRNDDIGSGTYFLHIIETLISYTESKDDSSDVDYADLQNVQFVLNSFAAEGGFPKLNRDHNNFDALLLDVLEETIRNNPGKPSKEIKKEYLYNLRNYLKQIAAYSTAAKIAADADEEDEVS